VLIDQVMAVATLERCYNNPKVFTGVVKIRKGETVRMIMMATNLDAVKAIFAHFVANVSSSSDSSSSSAGGFRREGRKGAILPNMPKVALCFALLMQCITNCAVKLTKFIPATCVFRVQRLRLALHFRQSPSLRSPPSFSAFGLVLGLWPRSVVFGLVLGLWPRSVAFRASVYNFAPPGPNFWLRRGKSK